MKGKKGVAGLLLIGGIVVLAFIGLAVLVTNTGLIKDGLNVYGTGTPTVTNSADGCEIKVFVAKIIKAGEYVNEPTLSTSYNVDWDFRNQNAYPKDYSCEITQCYVSGVACNSPYSEVTLWDAQTNVLQATCTAVDGLGQPYAGTGQPYAFTKFYAPPLTTNAKYWPYCGGSFRAEYTCKYLGDECKPVTGGSSSGSGTTGSATTDPGSGSTADTGGSGTDVDVNGEAPIDEPSWIEKIIVWLRSLFK